MLDVSSISAIVAAIGVTVGVVFAVLQLRDLVKARQTDLVMRLYSTFGSREFQEAWVETLRMEFSDYKDYLKKYGANSAKSAYVSVNIVADFFEGLGILLRRKLINLALVDDLFSSDIIITWHKMKPLVEGWREHFNRPQMSEWFEYLHNEMQKREQQLARTR
jgi:stress-induced morphogen